MLGLFSNVVRMFGSDCCGGRQNEKTDQQQNPDMVNLPNNQEYLNATKTYQDMQNNNNYPYDGMMEENPDIYAPSPFNNQQKPIKEAYREKKEASSKGNSSSMQNQPSSRGVTSQKICAKKNVKNWNQEEDNVLRVALQKYPGNWKVISEQVGSRSAQQCQQRWRRIMPENKNRVHWSKEDDDLVLNKVLHGNEKERQWGYISQIVGKGRTGKQVRERFLNVLDPTINKAKWENDEDEIIIQKFYIIGPKWSEISNFLKGRPENMVKNRFYSHIKKNLNTNIQKDYESYVKQEVDTFTQSQIQEQSSTTHYTSNQQSGQDINQHQLQQNGFNNDFDLNDNNNNSNPSNNNNMQLEEVNIKLENETEVLFPSYNQNGPNNNDMTAQDYNGQPQQGSNNDISLYNEQQLQQQQLQQQQQQQNQQFQQPQNVQMNGNGHRNGHGNGHGNGLQNGNGNGNGIYHSGISTNSVENQGLNQLVVQNQNSQNGSVNNNQSVDNYSQQPTIFQDENLYFGVPVPGVQEFKPSNFKGFNLSNSSGSQRGGSSKLQKSEYKEPSDFSTKQLINQLMLNIDKAKLDNDIEQLKELSGSLQNIRDSMAGNQQN